MSRTTALKIGYVGALFVLAAIAVIAIWALGGSTTAMLAVGLALLVPGRVQGFVFRDLFRARRLLADGDFAQSLAASQRFLDQIHKHPWQKVLVWLSWTVYTTDVEAMGLNNLGSAHLQCGEWEQASAFFREAIEVDGLYPLPFFNLAVIAELKGDHPEAKELLSAAKRRGFSGSSFDHAVSMGQELLSRVEGRGVPSHGGP